MAIQSILIDDYFMAIDCAAAATDVNLNGQPMHLLYREGYSALLAARIFFDNWLEIILDEQA